METRTLLRLLAIAQRAVAKHSASPSLSMARLTFDGEKVTVEGHDGFCGITASAPCDAEPMVIVAEPKALSERLKTIGDTVTITTDASGKIEIKAPGARRFSVRGMVPSDYVGATPETDSATPAQLDGSTLSKLISSVQHAVSQDETRPHVNCVLLEASGGTLRAVATDGHRLAMNESDCDDTLSFKVLVPARAIPMVLHVAEAGNPSLAIGERSFSVSCEGVVAHSNVPQADFPPYKQVIPKVTKKQQAEAPRALLADAIQAVAVSTKNGIKVTATNGALKLESADPDLGDATDEVAADFAGKTVTAGVAPRYLIDALASVTTDGAVVQLLGELEPIMITSTDDDGFVSVVMPMRV